MRNMRKIPGPSQRANSLVRGKLTHMKCQETVQDGALTRTDYTAITSRHERTEKEKERVRVGRRGLERGETCKR